MLEGLRVLHVMWRMSIGGAERAVYQLVREQRRRGTEADVAVANELGLYGERSRDVGASVHELGCRGALDVRHSRRLAALASDYEIVHHHGIEPLLIAASARARSPRLVYTHRGGVREHGWRKRLRLRVAKPHLRRFAGLSANTRQSAQALAGYLGVSGDDVQVVYNGLDFRLLDPLRSRDDVLTELAQQGSFMVGTVAKLQRWKRVHLLLEALVLLEDHEIHCLVIGDGPERTPLERQVTALGLERRVSFLGQRDHVGDYLQTMDVFVLPSGREEAFGNAAVEAMAVGVPAVVFEDGGGLREHVVDGSTGRVVRDAPDLAEAIAELARDEALRRRLGAEARRHVRAEYSLERMAERFEELYDRALSAPT